MTFGGGKKFLGVQKLQGQGEQQAYKKNNNKKWRPFLFVLETVKMLYFVRAPFEFRGRAPFKLVTPLGLLHSSYFVAWSVLWIS